MVKVLTSDLEHDGKFYKEGEPLPKELSDLAEGLEADGVLVDEKDYRDVETISTASVRGTPPHLVRPEGVEEPNKKGVEDPNTKPQSK